MVATDSYPGPQRPMLAAQLRLASEAGHQIVFDHLGASGFGDLRQPCFDLFRFPGPDGMTPSQLAAHLGMSKQALNPLLNELETLGYLHRITDRTDRRFRTLWLAPRGLALVAAIRDALDGLETRTRRRLGAQRYHELLEALLEIQKLDRRSRGNDHQAPP